MKNRTVLPADGILQTSTGSLSQAFREDLPRKRGLHRSASTARLVSHIRQLCVLGVDSHTLMPALLDAVGSLVGADWGMFWWADENYQPGDIYLDPEPLKHALALAQYAPSPADLAKHTRKAHGVDFATGMRRGYGWRNTARHPAAFLSSLEFELLWRPMHARHGLEHTVVQDGRGWGSFVFGRARDSPAFDARAEAALAPVSAFVAHAVRAPIGAHRIGAEAIESGIVVCDRTSHILWHSALGVHLMQQATPQPKPFTVPDKTIPDWLRPLIARLLRGCAREISAPPVMQRRTHWGEFTLRAYPLLDHDPELRSATCFAIHIERREPMVLQVSRGAHRLGLTRRQADICAHLAAGTSYPDIAQRIGIRPTSVIDQMRKMYTRLDVHDRPSLLRTLSTAALTPVDWSAMNHELPRLPRETQGVI
jgi:DNA-binding CsgD family transcriptional regulator